MRPRCRVLVRIIARFNRHNHHWGYRDGEQRRSQDLAQEGAGLDRRGRGRWPSSPSYSPPPPQWSVIPKMPTIISPRELKNELKPRKFSKPRKVLEYGCSKPIFGAHFLWFSDWKTPFTRLDLWFSRRGRSPPCPPTAYATDGDPILRGFVSKYIYIYILERNLEKEELSFFFFFKKLFKKNYWASVGNRIFICESGTNFHPAWLSLIFIKNYIGARRLFCKQNRRDFCCCCFFREV